MKLNFPKLLFLLALALPSVLAQDLPGWRLTWADEFNLPLGSPVDRSKWNLETGGWGNGNSELQYYTESTLNAVHDGRNLAITALEQRRPGLRCWYGPCRYTSARLNTRGKFEQRYGRFEARIKLPRGQGLWPAFWLLGNNIGTVSWPLCGEIDVMENIGREPRTVHGTLHGPGYSGGAGIGKPYTLPADFADAFHVFALEWEPQELRWYVDGVHYQTRTPADLPEGARWVFDRPFFLILNLAVGGAWPGMPDATTRFPQRMLVDYVRVYERTDGR
ncbi:MAG: hydrolase [Armatimonadota bacterium]